MWEILSLYILYILGFGKRGLKKRLRKGEGDGNDNLFIYNKTQMFLLKKIESCNYK